MFWLLAAALSALAIAFVLIPLRPTAGGGKSGLGRAEVDRNDMVRRLYSDRLAELEGERDVGMVSADAYGEVEQELAGVLLKDYADGDVSGEEALMAEGRIRVPGGWVFAVLIPMLAGWLYMQVGEPDADMLEESVQTFSLDPETDGVKLAQWRVMLEGRVSAHPDDGQSWYLLGHIHLKQKSYAQAASAFGSAHAVVGDDPSVDLYWLHARYLAAGGMLDDTSRDIAERILARQPNQPQVLEMLAVDGFRGGRFREVVGLLDRALSEVQDPGQRMALRAGLEQARAQLGDLVPGIDVSIEYGEVPPEGAVLFVIARPVGGGMPLTVVRRPLDEPPPHIRLDDAVSMNPAVPLSSVDTVEVVVRVSLAGTVMAHPGDWEWRSQPLALSVAQRVLNLTVSLSPPSG